MVDLICFTSGVSTERVLQGGSWSLNKTVTRRDVMRRIMKTTSGIFHFWLFDGIKQYIVRKGWIKLLNSRGERTAEKEAYTWNSLEDTFLVEKEIKALRKKKILTFKI